MVIMNEVEAIKHLEKWKNYDEGVNVTITIDFLTSIEELLEFNQRLQQEKENLIKYLEDKLTGNKTTDNFIVTGVLDLLEKVRSGKYE